MQKSKEMAEREFVLLLGWFTCATGAPTEIWVVPTAQPEQWMLQVTTFPFGCKASFVSPAETKGWALPEPTSFHLYSRLKFPLLQYNSWHAPGWICSQVTALHCILQKVLILPCLKLHMVSIDPFLGWVFLGEEMKLIVLCLFWLSTKNGKKVRVLIYA